MTGRRRALLISFGAAAALSFAMLATPATAWASTEPAVTGPSNASLASGTASQLTGLSVTSPGGVDLTVTLSISTGTLNIATTTGLSLAYNNSWSGTSSITFTGAPSALNAALQDAWATVSGTGSAHVSLATYTADSGYVFSPDSGHFYQYVNDSGITWDAAHTAADAASYRGQQGYLAQIWSAPVNDFISSKIQGAQNVWIGAESTDNMGGAPYQRSWHWVDGPLNNEVFSQCTAWRGSGSCTSPSGIYASWSSGQPDNCGCDPRGSSATELAQGNHEGEWVAVTNWQGSSGSWNDLSPDHPYNNLQAYGYVIEYGNLAHGSSTPFTGTASAAKDIPVISEPSAPQSLVVTRGNTVLGLSFGTPTSGGGYAITGYQYSVNGGTNWTALSTTGAGASLSAQLTGLTNGTQYTVLIRAVNSNNDTGLTASGTGIPATIPDAIHSFTATPAHSAASLAFAAPSSDGGTAITSYEYSLDGTNWHTLTTGGTSSALTATVTGLTNGVSYTIRVRAVNNVGTGPATQITTLAAAVPGPPQTFSITAHYVSADLSFTAPASDGGAAITGYQASSDGGSVWTTLTTSGATPITAQLSGLTVSTGYTILIRAVNAAGPGATASAAGATIAAPASAAVPTGTDAVDLGVNDSTPTQGGEITLTAEHFAPGTEVTFWLHSTPYRLGSSIAGSGGIAILRTFLPASAFGGHTVQAVGVGTDGSERTVGHPLTITVRGKLAATGSNTGGLFPLAFGLLLAGVLLRFARVFMRPREG